MPYSINGMAILDKFAPELTRASNLSVTIGRPMPAEIRAQPPEIVTARERPIVAPQPMAHGSSSPQHTLVASADPARPISTLAASSGQSYAPSAPHRTRGVVLAIGGLGAIVAASVAVVVVTRRSETSKPAEAVHSGVVVDASAPRTSVVLDASAPRTDTSPSTSALAIVTQPGGAEVFIDGISKGRAPLNIELPVGKKIELRAESSGYAPASRYVTIEPIASAIRLDLTPLIDAGTTAKPMATQPIKPPPKREDKTHGRKRDGSGDRPGAGVGSNQSFSPNDVL
jgi:hypothetical protein